MTTIFRTAPVIRQRFFDANGNPLGLGKLFTYVAGSAGAVNKPTYVAPGGGANTNPVVMDAFGYADVWLDQGDYLFILKDNLNNIIWTKDNVTSFETGTLASSVLMADGSTVQAAIDTRPTFAQLTAANVSASGGGTVQNAIDRLAAGYRAAPHASFAAWLDFSPRIIGPNNVILNRTISNWALSKYSALIVGDPVLDMKYTAGEGVAGASDANTGLTPQTPFATMTQAMFYDTSSWQTMLGGLTPAARTVFRKYDFSDLSAVYTTLKVVTVCGHAEFREHGLDPTALTFTVDGTYADTYNAPLAANNWAATTAYVLGDIVKSGNFIYYCITAGVSGAVAPTGLTVASPFDGAVRWASVPPVTTIKYNNRILVRKATLLAVHNAPNSFCVINGVVSIRGNTENINTNKAQLDFYYSWDANDGTNPELSYLQHRSTKTLYIVPEGSSLRLKGITFTADVRAHGGAVLMVDGGDCSTQRVTIDYPAAVGTQNTNSNTFFGGVKITGSKFDAFHYDGASKGMEHGCVSRFAGNIATWGFWTPSLNGSSCHDSGTVARFGGDYGFGAGPSVADAGTGVIWNCAVMPHDGSEVGNRFGIFGTGALTIYCDGCCIYNEAEADLCASSVDCHIYLSDTPHFTQSGSGVFAAYQPANL